jgi:hypothetical protein
LLIGACIGWITIKDFANGIDTGGRFKWGPECLVNVLYRVNPKAVN